MPEGEAWSSVVPRVCIDYFYVSNREVGSRSGVDALSTKELKRRLQELGRSSEGKINVLVKRYKASREDAEEEDDGDVTPAEGEKSAPHASDHPMMVMVDDATGNKYMRALPHKRIRCRGR